MGFLFFLEGGSNNNLDVCVHLNVAIQITVITRQIFNGAELCVCVAMASSDWRQLILCLIVLVVECVRAVKLLVSILLRISLSVFYLPF